MLWCNLVLSRGVAVSIRARRPPLDETVGIARYQPRHTSLSTEPEDPKSRRRVILVRTGLGLLLVGAALITASAFETGAPLKGHVAASVGTDHPTSAGTGHPMSVPSAGPSGTTGTTRARAGDGSPTTTAGAQTRSGHSSATATTNPSSATTNPSSATAPARALVTPPGFGPLLRHTWVAADPGHVGLTSSDVLATVAGTVYYAGQASISQYWAMSRFWPTQTALAEGGTAAGQALLAQFDKVAVFFKAPGRAWAYQGSYAVGGCPANVPAVVLQAWGICTVGS